MFRLMVHRSEKPREGSRKRAFMGGQIFFQHVVCVRVEKFENELSWVTASIKKTASTMLIV